jgi:hypothetical protein
MNKIAPETTKVNLDGEIDPQLRIDTMLEQCGRLDPPCVGFITRGHILGFEPFLNCAFVTRLFLSKHGLWIGEEHPQMKSARETLKELQTRWRAVMGTAQQLTDWDSWRKMRKKFRDIQLDDLMVRDFFFFSKKYISSRLIFFSFSFFFFLFLFLFLFSSSFTSVK